MARSYFRHIPPTYDGKTPMPLVMDFHGYAEGSELHKMTSQLGAFGDAEGFITVTPQGEGAIPRWDTTPGSADLVFVGELLDQLEAQLCIDRDRVYATGYSNGAFLTSAIACEYTDRVAAIAPVAGISEVPNCSLSRPMPVIAFHGTADGFVAYDGGLGEAALDLPAPDGSGRTLRDLGASGGGGGRPSVPDTMATWARMDGCADKPPVENALAPDVTLLAYECPPGNEVELYRINGGGHSWPGSQFSASIPAILGPTTMSINADNLMWAFFEDHPLPH